MCQKMVYPTHRPNRMSCGCGKKNKSFNPIFSDNPITSSDPKAWGPCFWFMMHTMAEKTGHASSPIINGDHAAIFRWLVEQLPTILPCQECQAHARTYLLAHPPTWMKAVGNDLRIQIRTWVFNFHTSVRSRIGQPTTVISPDDCIALYAHETINPAFITDLSHHITFAVRSGWVRIDSWKRWVTQFNRMKLMLNS